MRHCREAVSLYRALHAADPGNVQSVTDLALAQSELSHVLASQGRLSAALSELDRSTSLLREFLDSNRGNLPAGRQLGRNLLRSSLLHARLAARPGQQRLQHALQARALYASGRQTLTAALAGGTSHEDDGDDALLREALAAVTRAP
ncbi:MAG: hypothetical protein H0T90_05780 [Gemmatimonadales bacterium]|nr:hypothetical protein [Gemmatimonadales bacterium]